MHGQTRERTVAASGPAGVRGVQWQPGVALTRAARRVHKLPPLRKRRTRHVANHKSAEKRNRQRLKRRERNVFHLSTMRTYMKRLRKALEGGDLEGAKENLPLALQAIGKAASKGVIHRNTASRYASRVRLAFNKKNAPAA